MASHKKMQSSSTPQATPEEIMKIYSGVGKTFRVKFVGSEEIREKGDAVALACLKSLKTAQQQLGYHKPKAILGLNTKGLTLFDERSKANTRVAISKVSHLTHDPNDICYFGVVVMTTESNSGLKLYAFKAERQVAMQFNQSSKELFDLMFRLKEAKKKLRERREQEAAAAAAATEAAATTPAPKVVGGVEAPPDYHAALTFDVHKEDEEENPPPVPPRKSITEPEPLIQQDDFPAQQQQVSTGPLTTEERRQRAVDEWSKLESELDDIAKDLNLDTSGGQASTDLYSVPDKSRKLNSSGTFSDELLSLDLPSPTAWTNFDATEAQTSSPFTSTPASSNPQESISLQLNPFSAQPQTSSTFNSGVSAEYTNPAYNTNTSLEPNISMDLENILASPPQMQFPQQPAQPMASFGQPFGTQPMVTGMGQPMGYPQGPFQQQPAGMFQQPQQQAAPDLLSSPAGSDSFMAFSQPLQPASSVPAPPPGPPPKVDAFADLLDIAKKNAPELTPTATPVAPPPVKNEPKEYVSMNKMASIKDRPLPPVPGNDPFGMGTQPPPAPTVTTSPSTGFSAAFGGVEEIYDDFDFSSPNKPQQQTATPPAAATGGGGFGDSFAGAASSSNPPAAAPAQTGWVGFDDETKGQWL